MKSLTTTRLTPVRAHTRRRAGRFGRALLLLLLLAGAGGLTLKLYGNEVVPPLVDAVRGVIGPEGMAEVEAHYYDAMDVAHQWQRDLGLAPRVVAPWGPSAGSGPAAPEPPAERGRHPRRARGRAAGRPAHRSAGRAADRGADRAAHARRHRHPGRSGAPDRRPAQRAALAAADRDAAPHRHRAAAHEDADPHAAPHTHRHPRADAGGRARRA